MTITSLENEKIKNYIKLQRKKYRDLTNKYLVEGLHLVQEAYKAGLLEEVILLEKEENPFNVESVYVSPEVMKKISTLDTPITIIGVCRKSNNNKIVGNKILLLDNIQDPGNLGTIIRSAVAFNIDCIILSNDTVDLYNPKVLRATQGIYAYIPIIKMDSIEAIKKLKEDNFYIYGTDVNDGKDIRKLDNKNKNICLIMGNEGNGVTKEVKELCNDNIYIKTNNKVESLNVGVACSILLYELGRLDG